MSFWNKIEKQGFDPVTPSTSGTEPPPPPAAAPERLSTPPPPPASPSPAREDPAAPRGNHLRLGRGVRLEGKLTFSGTVRVDATFQGSIVTDGVLVVGEEAKVDAEISCGTVVVEGEVNGNVVAREAVEIRSTGTVRGDVETPSLEVERGAVFEGASRRPDRAVVSPSAGLAAATPAPSAH